MLTRTFLAASLFLFVLLYVVPLPAYAQIHGVPPSVTSFGFGGSNNPTPGVPASVTSLGPQGWDCCSAPIVVPFRPGVFDGRHFRNHQQFQVGEMMPAVIPYFVPYLVPYEDNAENKYDTEMARTDSRGIPSVYDRGPWYREAPAPAPRDAAPEGPLVSKPTASTVAPEATVEVAPQPATVLVYKDGHTQEVQNYAILGDTLFDFAGSRSHKIQLADLDLPATRKTNDDRGVEFRIPGEKSPEQ